VIPLLGRNVADAFARHLIRRVVDEDVEVAKLSNRALDQTRAVVLATDIA
jgi:hypothetical protein